MSKNRFVRQGLAQSPQKLINQFPLFKYSWADIHGKMRISRTIFQCIRKSLISCLLRASLKFTALSWNEKIPAEYKEKRILLMSKNRPVEEGFAQGPQKPTNIHGLISLAK